MLGGGGKKKNEQYSAQQNGEEVSYQASHNASTRTEGFLHILLHSCWIS